ncbi:uncharacterized protein LOC128040458 [Gossypium raimondii]|uniref:uncharacterized protein LOC128040458 n=1 Tax=Gossypium raimondii TaxID=29730 RepID=UPI00227AB9F4|nr:uncharacterized protein LOC128040458 [Gossypium raimondii]
MRPEARAPARAYVIHAREDASASNVITGTVFIYDTDITALIDSGSTYLYVFMNLVSSKKLPAESTEFVVKVSNPFSQYVLVDKVCLHDDVVNCRRKLIVIKCQNGEMLCIESENLSGLPIVISTMSAQKYVRKEELPGLLLIREVKFAIELVLETSLISIAPYRMAPTELKESKVQLHELKDRGFARPNFSP